MHDMIEADIWSVSREGEGNTVFLRLKGHDFVIPLFMDDRETGALLRAQNSAPFPGPERPAVHELFMNFIGKSGFTLLRAELYGLKDDLFYARLVFAGEGWSESAPLFLEALPADALTLALRAKRPIQVSQDVAGRAGLPGAVILEGLARE